MKCMYTDVHRYPYAHASEDRQTEEREKGREMKRKKKREEANIA